MSDEHEPIYVKLVLLAAPTLNDDGTYHIPLVVEHTNGLPLKWVASLLQHAADELSGGEIDG